MDKLVEALFERIELMVLGTFALGLFAYFLAIYHPLKRLLIEYVTALDAFWLGNISESPSSTINLRHWLRVAVLVGATYYLGVVSNLASYWLVEPVRFRILDQIYAPNLQHASNQLCKGNKAEDLDIIDAMTLPIIRLDWNDKQVGMSNGLYLKDESKIRSSDKSTLPQQLSGILIFTRLLRGTVLFSLGYFIVSCLKTLVALIFFAILCKPKSDGEIANFEELIDEKRQWLESDADNPFFPTNKEKREIIRRRIIFPHVLIGSLSLFLYWASMGAYRASEFEYSSLVRYGAGGEVRPKESCAPQSSSSDSKKPSVPGAVERK